MRLTYIFILLFLVACSTETAEEKYDRESGQTPVLSREKIDQILDGFGTISFSELDNHYKDYTDPEVKFRDELSEKTYYIVQGNDVFKYIVGKNRISQFLCMDNYYASNAESPESHQKQYWLVDKNLLYMILDLMLELEKQGFDKDGFIVRESHRHPRKNKARGGASLSQHIFGTAADLTIEDINRDGKIEDEDKQIVLDILENIVGNKGGLGLYPRTLTVHLDTRGKRARWNYH